MRAVLRARWVELGDKIVAIAEAFPPSAYDERPVTEVRSFGEQLRHIAFWNQYVTAALQGTAIDGQPNELPRAAYPTKAEVVDVLKTGFTDVVRTLGVGDQPVPPAVVDTMISFLEHNGEHYGQLAVYCRLRGIVPPASR